VWPFRVRAGKAAAADGERPGVGNSRGGRKQVSASAYLDAPEAARHGIVGSLALAIDWHAPFLSRGTLGRAHLTGTCAPGLRRCLLRKLPCVEPQSKRKASPVAPLNWSTACSLGRQNGGCCVWAQARRRQRLGGRGVLCAPLAAPASAAAAAGALHARRRRRPGAARPPPPPPSRRLQPAPARAHRDAEGCSRMKSAVGLRPKVRWPGPSSPTGRSSSCCPLLRTSKWYSTLAEGGGQQRRWTGALGRVRLNCGVRCGSMGRVPVGLLGSRCTARPVCSLTPVASRPTQVARTAPVARPGAPQQRRRRHHRPGRLLLLLHRRRGELRPCRPRPPPPPPQPPRPPARSVLLGPLLQLPCRAARASRQRRRRLPLRRRATWHLCRVGDGSEGQGSGACSVAAAGAGSGCAERAHRCDPAPASHPEATRAQMQLCAFKAHPHT
jgi:hypothetical protein